MKNLPEQNNSLYEPANTLERKTSFDELCNSFADTDLDIYTLISNEGAYGLEFSNNEKEIIASIIRGINDIQDTHITFTITRPRKQLT